MNTEEAKFILAAYRPDGRDTSDPQFAAAIARTEEDPALRAWWERQRSFDAAVAGKLAAVAPPPELRAAILAGGRVSRPRVASSRRPVWLAAAAAVVVLLAVAAGLQLGRGAPTPGEFAALAVRELDRGHDAHVGAPPGLAEVREALAVAAAPLPQTVRLDPADLARRRCRTLRLGGREVFEVCFQRDGTWFHLYVARRADFAPGDTNPRALLTSRGGQAGTAWADGDVLYALVTAAGSAALQRLL